MAKQHSAFGFTLMELMIAVAIVGILAAIAYPSYEGTIRKGRRADGKAALMTLQQAQEKMRATCPLYAGTLGAASNTCGATAAATLLTNSATSTEGYYTLSITSPSSTTYTLSAAATTKNGQSNDTACTPLTLNQAGTKTPATGCW